MFDYLYESEEDLDIYDYDDDTLDFDNSYEDAYLEGYYDALCEMKMNPLPIIGGGDFKGDIMSIYNMGDMPHRVGAVRNYLSKGNTIKGGMFGGVYGMTPEGVAYRKNRFLPGSYNDNSGDVFFDDIYLRLKPADRKKLITDYMKKHKIKSLK